MRQNTAPWWGRRGELRHYMPRRARGGHRGGCTVINEFGAFYILVVVGGFMGVLVLIETLSEWVSRLVRYLLSSNHER